MIVCAQGGFVITLASILGVYDGLDLPIQLIGATAALSRRAISTITSTLTMENLTVVLVDKWGSAVISAQAGFLAIALVDTSNLATITMRACPFRRTQGQGGGIATV